MGSKQDKEPKCPLDLATKYGVFKAGGVGMQPAITSRLTLKEGEKRDRAGVQSQACLSREGILRVQGVRSPGSKIGLRKGLGLNPCI